MADMMDTRWVAFRCRAWIGASLLAIVCGFQAAWGQEAGVPPLDVPSHTQISIAEMLIDQSKDIVFGTWVLWQVGKLHAEVAGWRQLLGQLLEGAQAGKIQVNFNITGHEVLTSALKHLTRTIRDTAVDVDEVPHTTPPHGPTDDAKPDEDPPEPTRKRRTS